MMVTAGGRMGVNRVVSALAIIALVAMAASYYYVDMRASNNTSKAHVMVIMPQGVGGNTSLNFQPASITVIIGLNNTVTWTNNDTLHDHTVTATTGPTTSRAFDSGNMGRSAVFTFTFTVPGTYEYVCAFHEWMRGTVVVKPS